MENAAYLSIVSKVLVGTLDNDLFLTYEATFNQADPFALKLTFINDLTSPPERTTWFVSREAFFNAFVNKSCDYVEGDIIIAPNEDEVSILFIGDGVNSAMRFSWEYDDMVDFLKAVEKLLPLDKAADNIDWESEMYNLGLD